MNNLYADIGYQSINYHGEELCGDNVEIIKQEDGSIVLVLADGLGSGVKASILSTLTSKILSTMIAEGLPLEDCVKAVAATLPVCSERELAYSTFTIIRIINNTEAEIIQYDNPMVILLRDGKNYEYPITEINFDGKTIYRTKLEIKENDIFIAMSDGCPHAGVGNIINMEWKREDIIEYMEVFYDVGFTARTLSTILIDKVSSLYDNKPSDDATVCTIRIRKRQPVNLLFGPPNNPDDCDKMMSLFFSKEGKKIVSGGTTASLAAKFLNKDLKLNGKLEDIDVPPTSEIEGVDLVTEGVITISKVLSYAKDYLADNETYQQWIYKNDGASLICKVLFEEATDINFFVGKAVNPAHQVQDLPISFDIKMNLVKELSNALEKMGKNIKLNYF